MVKKKIKRSAGKKVKSESKDFSLKRNFSLGCNYLKQSKKFVYAIVALFFLFAIIGFIFPAPDAVLQRILELIRNILEQTEGLSFRQLFTYIFVNNFKVSLLGLVTGILFGVFPIIISIGNGYLLGFVGRYSANELGILSLWKIFPHGVFELPAVFISLGLGLRLGMVFFNRKEKSLKEDFYNSLRVFFLIVVPLLFIAALIETSLIFFFG